MCQGRIPLRDRTHWSSATSPEISSKRTDWSPGLCAYVQPRSLAIRRKTASLFDSTCTREQHARVGQQTGTRKHSHAKQPTLTTPMYNRLENYKPVGCGQMEHKGRPIQPKIKPMRNDGSPPISLSHPPQRKIPYASSWRVVVRRIGCKICTRAYFCTSRNHHTPE